jgi:hypothetical protein
VARLFLREGMFIIQLVISCVSRSAAGFLHQPAVARSAKGEYQRLERAANSDEVFTGGRRAVVLSYSLAIACRRPLNGRPLRGSNFERRITN